MALVFAANYELSQLAIGKLILTKFGNSTLILSLKWPYGSSNGYSPGTIPGAGHSKGSGSVPCLALPIAMPWLWAMALPWWC